MKILLLGGSGFIARPLRQRLEQDGHHVSAPSRRQLDLRQPRADWRHWLENVDVVVNAAGQLLDRPAGALEAIHHLGPLQLASMAYQADVRRWVQLSALGADPQADTLFLASKGRGDAALLASGLEARIARPSLIYGPQGASSRLLLQLARLPLWLLPDGGSQRVQPVARDDVIDGLARLAAADEAPEGVVDFVGAEALTLADYLRQLRQLQGLSSPAYILNLPPQASRALATLAERWPASLISRDTLAMLNRGSCGDPAALGALLQRAPLASSQFREAPLFLAACGLDLAFGLLTLLRPCRALWRAQAAAVAGYSLTLAIWLPENWLHPFAPLMKNLPILAMLLWLGARRETLS
ncbi:NAD(P)H-binding protein [Chromobacterium haemolyticum]|uniref:NAD(P)H-binding protein n=1 Tax=Chromobacterium haemolyticum TaxID=394935 RepID=UPI00405635AC